MTEEQENNGRIKLEKLPNTRDLGNIKTHGGKHIKSKCLIRSGALHDATKCDIVTLSDIYEVRTVIDLRTEEERNLNPDPVEELPKTKFLDLPLLSGETLGITRESKASMLKAVQMMAKDPVGIMKEVYPKMVLDPASQKGLRDFFNELLETNEGAVLWHCTAGKDRAGLAAVMLLTVLEVPQQTIYDDYLATNKFIQANTKELIKSVVNFPLPESIQENIQVLNSADLRFLQAALDALDSEYGGIDAYIRNELDVTTEKAEGLRTKYLTV